MDSDIKTTPTVGEKQAILSVAAPSLIEDVHVMVLAICCEINKFEVSITNKMTAKISLPTAYSVHK